MTPSKNPLPIQSAPRHATYKRSFDEVARHMATRSSITRSQMEEADDSTIGERAADAVARFGGSWTFIMLFALVLLAWVGVNSVLLAKSGGKPFDPFPYILLNLFLSMLASIQAPVILMSQNRQGKIDRERMENDYEVNLKAELEIMAMHEKIDAHGERIDELLALLKKMPA
ncbi:DUF1003 domain-containing protein [Massilia glaciei]|uniref:DUF1003 domain-containing protein n=1 Tax=Massilia glaciei TaxID=1524097 RepID=A0A2U2HDM3_9BURK|nr:DUF1003 domain-containing protein [Massilia glaciei]PWF41221.1 DUF1003 domain-containing protein [Massilia glaciei]